MDADLSNRPNELKLLIAGIETGYDICMGRGSLPGAALTTCRCIRRFGNKIFVTIVNVLYGSHYTDMCYGYRSFAAGCRRDLTCRRTASESRPR